LGGKGIPAPKGMPSLIAKIKYGILKSESELKDAVRRYLKQALGSTFSKT
jgi:hypothetical protein